MANKRVEALIHKYMYQDTDKLGVPCGKGSFSQHGGNTAHYDGPLFYHYDTVLAVLLPHPTKEDHQLLFVRTCRDADKRMGYHGPGIDDITCSNSTRDIIYQLRRAANGDTTVILLPTDLDYVTDAADSWYDSVLRTIPSVIDRIDKLVAGEEFHKQKDAEWLWQVIQRLWHLHALDADVMPEWVLNRWESAINSYYSNKIENGKKCAGYVDYVIERDKHVRACRQYDTDIWEARSKIACANRKADDLVRAGREELAKTLIADTVASLDIDEEAMQDLQGNKHVYFPAVPSDLLRKAIAYIAEHKLGDKFRWTQRYDTGFDTLHIAGPDSLVTSRQVILAGPSFRMACAMAKAAVAGKSLVGKHVGPYKVDAQTENTITVGCHVFHMGHVAFFAAHCHLSAKEYADILYRVTVSNAPAYVRQLQEMFLAITSGTEELRKKCLDAGKCEYTTDQLAALQTSVEELEKEKEEYIARIREANQEVRKAVNAEKKKKQKEAKLASKQQTETK